MVGAVLGFPKAAENVDVSVKLSPEPEGELWERNFGGNRFSSFQAPGTDREERLLTERFGLISVALALVVKDKKLFLVPRHWRVGKIPLPRFLMPNGESFETEIDGRFHFDVCIQAPVVGLIVHYQGSLGEDGV